MLMPSLELVMPSCDLQIGPRRNQNRLLISQGHNLCKLKYISLVEVTILYFQQWFQNEATESNLYRLYLKLFRPRSNIQAQEYNLFKFKSSLFSDF